MTHTRNHYGTTRYTRNYYGNRAAYLRINTFIQVAQRYNSIKPIVSKCHTGADDIRPIDSRKQKWNRIEKVHDTKYILHDNMPKKETHPNTYWDRYIDYPPIVWERKGSKEYITIRPKLRPYDVSRVQFIRNYLPNTMCLAFSSSSRMTINDVFIPSPKVEGTDYHLTFERSVYDDPNSWKCITKPWTEFHMVVDKEKKAALREPLEEFYKWVCAIGPMLPVNDYDFRKQQQREIREHYENKYIATGDFETYLDEDARSRLRLSGDISTDVPTEIVKDCDHPLRTALATRFLSRSNIDISEVRTEEDRKKFRGQFNAWVNRDFGLLVEREKKI